MAATLKGRIGGAEVPIDTATAGGAITAGDLLVASGGKLITATGGTNAVPIIAVAVSAAAADTDPVQVAWLLPDVLLSIPIHTGDTITAGMACGVDATTLELSDDEATTALRLRVLKVDPDAAASRIVTSIGWTYQG